MCRSSHKEPVADIVSIEDLLPLQSRPSPRSETCHNPVNPGKTLHRRLRKSGPEAFLVIVREGARADKAHVPSEGRFQSWGNSSRLVRLRKVPIHGNILGSLFSLNCRSQCRRSAGWSSRCFSSSCSAFWRMVRSFQMPNAPAARPLPGLTIERRSRAHQPYHSRQDEDDRKTKQSQRNGEAHSRACV